MCIGMAMTTLCKRPIFFRGQYFLGALFSIGILHAVSGVAEEAGFEEKSNTIQIDEYLNLGTLESKYGGEDFFQHDRTQIGNQIKTFIPPLLAPAVTQHAYVLPPGSLRVDFSQRHISLDGDDFFRDGEVDSAIFSNFEVDRQLTDLDFFYGFDLNKKYLHSFTLRVNVPYRNVQTNGSVNPHGQSFISLENAGSAAGLGDVGVFIKKKLFDQANTGFGLAVVGAVFFPTGSNEETFGSNGRITARRPQPPNGIVAQGFDALQRANVENGTWGDRRCFFRNFNIASRENVANPGLCNGNPSFSAPGAAVQSFSPGGANFDNSFVGDFPFNNGVFGRFSDDGRLPSILQPGTGSTSYLLGAFLTRQFSENSPIGRAAFHTGFSHKFVSESDGIDPGDKTTYFASFVKPLYKDFLSADLSLIAFDQEQDSYAGRIPEPDVHTCLAEDIGVVSNCLSIGDEAFIFDIADRGAFTGGTTGFFAPSLIFSPNPQLRMTLSGLVRVKKPDLGPAPENVLRFAISVNL